MVKQVFAIAAALFVFVVLALSFGTARADPRTEYLPNETATLTPTETATFTPTETAAATETATAMPTIDPCSVAPPPPTLVAPQKGASIDSTTVTFKWKQVECNKRYRAQVRIGGAKGSLVWTAGSKKNQLTATGLGRGYTYYWRVRACTTQDICTWSKYRAFSIPSYNPPPPPTATPGPTPVGGTPVPTGNPPPQIAVYKGDGVYLNNIANQLYRFSCGPDGWKQFRQGSTMYHIGLWFTPNERINFSRLDFNTGQIVETATLYANSSGYVSYNVDTSGWTPAHHYHMIFDGTTSGIERCGHFDLIPNTAPESQAEHPPHTQAEWQQLEERMNSQK
jgi:hypothetical protein